MTLEQNNQRRNAAKLTNTVLIIPPLTLVQTGNYAIVDFLWLFNRLLTISASHLQMEWIRMKTILIASIAVLVALSGCSKDNAGAIPPNSTSIPDSPATTVFTNGRIYTVDHENPWAQAVAVRGKDIVYVGDEAGIDAYVGEDTESVDLGGKMMLPGFVDSHIHTVGGGMIMAGVDLQSDSVDEIMQLIRDYVAANPDAEIIQGYGVRFNPWNDDYPTAAMLDEIESERPMYFWAIDGHAAWVNSKALEIAGITKDSPDPAPGFSYYIRDDSGNPTGWIMEVPAQLEVLSALVDFNADYIGAGVKNWLSRISAAGITSAQDLGITGIDPRVVFSLYQSWEDAGELPVRLQGVYYWNDKDEDPIPPLKALANEFNSELVKVTHLKINIDGGDDKHNALYVDPYSDKPDLKVSAILPYNTIEKALVEADAAGIDSVCHCFGDLAVRWMLDAVEKAQTVNPDRERNHYVSHGTLIHPDDISRFAELDVAYDTTGAWMSFDPLMQSIATTRLGPKRVDRMYASKAIHDAGGLVSYGSDWPVSGYVSEYRPLMAIQVGAMRQLPGREDVKPLGGKEARIPVELGIRMHTLNAANVIGIDHITGSIEVGKRADLVILDKNLLEIPASEIRTSKVLLTMMNGEIRHREGI